MSTAPNAELVCAILKSQYRSALAMLRRAIELCPDELWTGQEHRNQLWQVAYHTLFFADCYLQHRAEDFRPWAEHVADVQVPDCIPGPPDPESDLPLIPEPYSREQLLRYCDLIVGMVDRLVDGTDVFSEDSGFSWYPVPKLEHQLVNIRHIQHGAAQIADRLRGALDVGVDWVGAVRPRAAPP